jgi:hypothetical protein
MTAAFIEYDNATLVQLVRRFVTIVLSGRTEQQLTADEKAQDEALNPGHAQEPAILAAAGAGTVAGAALTAGLVARRHRRRRLRTRRALA